MANREGSRHEPKSEAHARLGAQLRELRKARGLSQRALAAGVFSDSHLANVENGLVTPSTALLEHYIAKCGGDYSLLDLMLADVLAHREHQRRERRASERGEPIAQADGQLYERPDPYRLYRLASIETYTTYDYHGIPTDFRAHIAIRAKVPGLNRYYFGIGCHGDYRRGAMELLAGEGCHIGEFHESDKGVHNGYFELDRELSPEDAAPYEFSFAAKYHTHMRVDQPLVSQPKTETARYLVQVQFTPPSLPAKVWWYDVATAVEVEDDQPEDQTMPTSLSGYYRHEFTRLVIGRVYGFGWRWE